jgi:outer membrane cobalamin receptor
VITRADIERWQLSDFVSALGRQAGVEFAQTGGPGSAASLFVRGANSSQVLVLVDGIRMNAAAGGAASIGGIALDTIDRIEISRGNLSSLYGSAAVGGVVQIFTRSGQQPGASFASRRADERSHGGAGFVAEFGSAAPWISRHDQISPSMRRGSSRSVRPRANSIRRQSQCVRIARRFVP